MLFKRGSYNVGKDLSFSSCLEKSLNSVKVLEKYLVSLLGLEIQYLVFPSLYIPSIVRPCNTTPHTCCYIYKRLLHAKLNLGLL